MTPDVTAIVKALTKAQWQTVLWMGHDGQWCRPDRRSMPALKRLGLSEATVIRAVIFDRLTPLGLAVCDQLMKEKAR